MASSESHEEKQRKKAIKDGNNQEETYFTADDLIENKRYKEQFRAAYENSTTHKKNKHSKKVSKRTNPKAVKEETEPDHIHYQNERWNDVTTIKSNERNKRSINKGNKYKK